MKEVVALSHQSANVLELGKTPAATVLKLSWPTILEQVAFTVLNFADTAMVGVLGASYTAAVGITTPVLWLTSGIIAAVSVGFSVLVAQDIGAGNLRRASRTAGQSLLAAVVTGVLLMIAGLLVTPFLPGWLGAEPAVATIAAQYFGVMCVSFLVNSVEVIMAAILRCTGDTHSPLVANSIAIFLNIFLNWLFIYPTRSMTLFGSTFTVWGAGMGAAGAALGSVLSILVATILIAKPFFGGKRGIHFTKEDILHPDRDILTRAAALGTPVALERITLSLGQVVFMRIVSTMGTTAIAAHHLAIQAESLSYMPSFGFSIAATTLVGQAIGAEDRERARSFGRIAANMSMVLMTATGVLLFFFGELMLHLFTKDMAVIVLGGSLLRIVAFAQPPEALAGVYAGALRGAGDSRWPFYINLIGVWGVRITFAAIFVLGFGWGLQAAWWGMFADLLFRGIVCRKRFLNNLA